MASETMMIAIGITLLAAVGLLAVLFLRRARPPDGWEGRLAQLEANGERTERLLREELARSREEALRLGRESREELARSARDLAELVASRLAEGAAAQQRQLETVASHVAAAAAAQNERLDRINETVASRLGSLQQENAAQLERMRLTVDEKLHDTLERRLGDSFRIVSDRLELVQRGLGEMQSLAAGVGDLKRVLANVKTRGTFGEIQLGCLLEQILTPDQYVCNAATKKGSDNRVEYAIRLPGRDESGDGAVWLPVDAKFPQEDYLRLLEAQDRGDAAAAEAAGRQLERTIREMGRAVRDRYLDPPHTTDFAIMFLPTEGLYAEVLRRTGLVEQLQREHRVIPAGPTTLAALLNSLQMGFRTLAIEKRASEVWTLLGAIKADFSSFGAILEKTRKKLAEASNTIDDAARRSRTIAGRLRSVQELPGDEAAAVLGVGESPSGREDQDE
jgi:DNA recombination protein RmuC